MRNIKKLPHNAGKYFDDLKDQIHTIHFPFFCAFMQKEVASIPQRLNTICFSCWSTLIVFLLWFDKDSIWYFCVGILTLGDGIHGLSHSLMANTYSESVCVVTCDETALLCRGIIILHIMNNFGEKYFYSIT